MTILGCLGVSLNKYRADNERQVLLYVYVCGEVGKVRPLIQ